jgi:hypothetical protein
MKNHALVEGGESWRERLGKIRIPTLVLHSTEDPLFSYEHGVALSNEIPGAQFYRSSSSLRSARHEHRMLAEMRIRHVDVHELEPRFLDQPAPRRLGEDAAAMVVMH